MSSQEFPQKYIATAISQDRLDEIRQVPAPVSQQQQLPPKNVSPPAVDGCGDSGGASSATPEPDYLAASVQKILAGETAKPQPSGRKRNTTAAPPSGVESHDKATPARSTGRKESVEDFPRKMGKDRRSLEVRFVETTGREVSPDRVVQPRKAALPTAAYRARSEENLLAATTGSRKMATAAATAVVDGSKVARHPTTGGVVKSEGKRMQSGQPVAGSERTQAKSVERVMDVAKTNPTRSKSKVRTNLTPSKNKVRTNATRSKSKIRTNATRLKSKVRTKSTRSKNKVRTTATRSKSKVRTNPTRSKSKVRTNPIRSKNKVRTTATRSKSKVRTTATRSKSKVRINATPSKSKVRISFYSLSLFFALKLNHFSQYMLWS